MGSVKRRITIEEYHCGGFGIHLDEPTQKETMGLKNITEVKKEISKYFKD